MSTSLFILHDFVQTNIVGNLIDRKNVYEHPGELRGFIPAFQRGLYCHIRRDFEKYTN